MAPAKKQKGKGAPPIPAVKARKPVVKKLTRAEKSAINRAAFHRIRKEEVAKLPPAVPRAVVQGEEPRPTLYDVELGKKICLMFATDPDMSLLKLNRDPELPTVWTFYEWLRDNPTLDKLYTQAQELHTDLQAAQLEEMTATPLIGEVRTKRTGKGFKTEEVKTYDNVERMKVRVSVRQWLLAKRRPKKYGTAEDNVGTGQNAQLTALFDALKAGPAEPEE